MSLQSIYQTNYFLLSIVNKYVHFTSRRPFLILSGIASKNNKNFSSLVSLFQISVGIPRILAELEEKLKCWIWFRKIWLQLIAVLLRQLCLCDISPNESCPHIVVFDPLGHTKSFPSSWTSQIFPPLSITFLSLFLLWFVLSPLWGVILERLLLIS